jgi:uncharacterized protein YbcC (UPF0753/DUF2309 family)
MIIPQRFALNDSIEILRSYLPNQGPIKNFVANLKFPKFLSLDFDEALKEGERVYRAASYMPLGYYRQKFKEGVVSLHSLKSAIFLHLGDVTPAQEAFFLEALHELQEISEFTSLLELGIDRAIFDDFYPRVTKALSMKRPACVEPLRPLLNGLLGQNIDHEINPVIFRLLGSYLDQGVSWWPFFKSERGFFNEIKYLVKGSVVPLVHFVPNVEIDEFLGQLTASEVIEKALMGIVGSPGLFSQYLFESMMVHPGWSGMVNAVENNPDMLGKPCLISLTDVLAVKLTLEYLFIKRHQKVALTLNELAKSQSPIQAGTSDEASLLYFLKTKVNRLELNDETLSHVTPRVLKKIWHEALEMTYYQEAGLTLVGPSAANVEHPAEQAIFCMDDRECSMRRWLEKLSPSTETFSTPGFFNIDSLLLDERSKMKEKICPLPVTPHHVVVRNMSTLPKSSRAKYLTLANYAAKYGANNILLDFLAAHTMGHLSALSMMASLFWPQKKFFNSSEIKETATNFQYVHDEAHPTYGEYSVGYTDEEMAARLKKTLITIGLTKNFSPMVYFIAHGSSSANNPHFAAYDCGACSGRPGAVNAMVLAQMANRPSVRAILRDSGLHIPDTTVFIGGYHNTCTDEVEFFDTEDLVASQVVQFKKFQKVLAEACMHNAKERCEKFALVPSNMRLSNYLVEVKNRSHALFEPRPELGHARNALGIVGRRVRTKGKNFFRRAFLQSYDPLNDSDGAILADILSAFIPVGAGINLEYMFSRLDPGVYGSGTKISHNVCSLLGVGNGLDDDLRFGLPIQMTELHEPIRLFVILEQTPEVIMKSVVNNPVLRPWIKNQWIRLGALLPNRDELLFYSNQKDCFVPFLARSTPNV